MLDKLPCTLTAGVTATREGLVFSSGLMITPEYFRHRVQRDIAGPVLALWPDAAHRLRYRKGEPWQGIICEVLTSGTPQQYTGFCEKGGGPLHRLAAILCDDAEAFRILYWCVTNLGGNNE